MSDSALSTTLLLSLLQHMAQLEAQLLFTKEFQSKLMEGQHTMSHLPSTHMCTCLESIFLQPVQLQLTKVVLWKWRLSK